MKIRLSYKILAVFFVLSVFSVILSIGLLRYFAISHFEKYIREKDLNYIRELIPALVDFYAEHKTWDQLKDNSGLWKELTTRNLVEGSGPWPRRRGAAMEQGFFKPGKPAPVDAGIKEPMPPGPFPIEFRIGLFDADRRLVTGSPGPLGSFFLQPIILQEQTVGWIGLKKLPPPPPRRVEMEFINRQFRVFYVVGGILLLVSALVAVILSRSLLSPVRRLSEATHALSQRRFDKRAEVNSSDELGQLARDFNSMAEQLEKYEARQKQWLSDISHELRTPLSIIVCEIEALQDGIRPTDEKSLASLHAEALHMQKIVNDLHQLSLAEAGALSLNKSRIDLCSVLQNVVELMRERCLKSGLDVLIEPAGNENLHIDADMDRLRQVFTNIIENSVQYVEKPGQLMIRAWTADHQVFISFEDSGPGVPDQALPYLFDRLTRVESSRSRASGGSGLGLAICKSIVESHGGSIQAANSAQGGLRLVIEFNLHAG